MSHLMEILWTTGLGILQATYMLWLQMGIYLVFGFTVAGVLSRFLKSETIARHLGGNTFSSVVKAALLGVPSPLCSCGVVPVGLSLLKCDNSHDVGSTPAATHRLRVLGMTCEHCARHVREAAESVAGIESARVDLQKETLTVTGTGYDPAALALAISQAGYEAREEESN